MAGRKSTAILIFRVILLCQKHLFMFCVLAGPSPPLPASPPRPARATAPRSLPLSGAEPASPLK